MSTQQHKSERNNTKENFYFVAVCQHCDHNYIIGISGTVEGCDKCMHITRNAIDHTIIDPGNSFLHQHG